MKKFNELEIEIVARLCHEANKAICEAQGDYSQLPWGKSPEWQQKSAKQGVAFVQDNLTAPVSATHENWMRDKLADGWTFGEVKDPQAKTHPCIVPYDQLPFGQRVKDHVFQSIVRTIMAIEEE